MASGRSKKDGSNFEENLNRLETVVERLEDGSLSLEESLKAFEEGMTLYHRCVEALDKARNRVEMLLKRGEEMVAQPLPSVGTEAEEE